MIKRLLLATLFTTAILAAVPALLGLGIEQKVLNSPATPPYLQLQRDSWQRGWFESRVDSLLRLPGAQADIKLSHRIQHIAASSQDNALVVRVESHLHSDASTPLPPIVSEIHQNQQALSWFDLEQFRHDGLQITNLRMQFDHALDQSEGAGRVQATSGDFQLANHTCQLQGLNGSWQLEKSDNGRASLEGWLDMDHLSCGETLAIHSLSVNFDGQVQPDPARSDELPTLLSGGIGLSFDRADQIPKPVGPMESRVNFKRLPTNLFQLLSDGNDSQHPLDRVNALLSHNPIVALERLYFMQDDQEFDLSLIFEPGEGPVFNPFELWSRSRAQGNLRISRDLASHLLALYKPSPWMSPIRSQIKQGGDPITSLRDAGFIKIIGQDVATNIDLKHGQLLLNDQPLPLLPSP